MRFKHVPVPPDSLATVIDAQRAVPLVPDREDECCERLMRRCGFPSRDVARTWLTFLRALGLVERTGGGFRRRRVDPDPGRLRGAVRGRVFGGREVLDALESGDPGRPVTLDEAFARVRDRVPPWERHRAADWEGLWRDRVERLLGWFVLLGLAERVDGGYLLGREL